MYQQIDVLPRYWKYQHIFWCALPLDELKEYQLNTVTYGLNCAPYLALRVLKDFADNCCEWSPGVKYALTSQTYVDGICVVADSIVQLLTLKSGLERVLGTAKFELKKWSSNTPQLLASIPPEDRAQSVVLFDDTDMGLVKVLGLNWNSCDDTFGFEVSFSCDKITKHAVLSTVARIFDSIGHIHRSDNLLCQTYSTENLEGKLSLGWAASILTGRGLGNIGPRSQVIDQRQDSAVFGDERPFPSPTVRLLWCVGPRIRSRCLPPFEASRWFLRHLFTWLQNQNGVHKGNYCTPTWDFGCGSFSTMDGMHQSYAWEPVCHHESDCVVLLANSFILVN